jgi:hypothetical protein
MITAEILGVEYAGSSSARFVSNRAGWQGYGAARATIRILLPQFGEVEVDISSFFKAKAGLIGAKRIRRLSESAPKSIAVEIRERTFEVCGRNRKQEFVVISEDTLLNWFRLAKLPTDGATIVQAPSKLLSYNYI